MYDLTISIVSYNNMYDILALLESLYQYVSPVIKKKIYIINNSQTEDISDIADKYSEVEIVQLNENLGFGKGHNFVLNKLDSQFHAIVNPDILFTEDAFSKIMNFMSDESIGMCIPKLVDEENHIQQAYRREVTVWDMFLRMFCKKMFKKRMAYHTMLDQDYSKPFQVPFAQGSFLVIRTELLKTVGGFDDRYFMYLEDADLCKRINVVSNVMYFPNATVIHKWEKGSHKNIKLFRIHIKSIISYFNKWGL